MKHFLIHVLTLIASVYAQVALATVYYVSPAGSDSNSGTATNLAWQTITHANSHSFSAGDELLFQGGMTNSGTITFSSAGGTATSPILISSYGSSVATITATNADTFYALNSGGLIISNINFAGVSTGTNGSGIEILNNTANSMRSFFRIANVDVGGFGRSGVFIHGTTTTSGIGNLQMTYVTAHNNTLSGIESVGGSWFVHTNFYIGYCNSWNNPGISTITTHSGDGIVLGGVSNAIVEYCVASNNATVGTGAVGIWCWYSRNVTFQYCESHHNHTGGGTDGDGFDIDIGNQNILLLYCYSHDNDGAAFPFYQGLYTTGGPAESNCVVRYNISQNDGRKNSYGAVSFWNDSTYPGVIGPGMAVYNNTIFISSATSGTPAGINFIDNTFSNVSFYNNCIVTTNGIKLINSSGTTPNTTFQGNEYWPSGGTFSITMSGSTYSSLAAWRSAGFETVGTTNVGLNLNPQLVNAGGGGTLAATASQLPAVLPMLTAYQTQSTSPLRGAGLNLYTLFGINTGAQDYYGDVVSTNGSHDIGAYNAPTTTTPLISALPTASAITYGQTLASSTLNGGSATNATGGAISGTFTFSSPGIAPNAGSTNVSVTFTPMDTTDYNNATTNVSVTVNPQTPQIAATPTASVITYGQTLAGSSLIGGSATNAAGGLVNGSFAFLTPGIMPNAGGTNVAVGFTPTDTVDYNNTSSSVSVTVNKATPVITVAPAASAILFGQALASSTLSGGSATNTAGGAVVGIFSFDSPSTVPGAGTASQLVDFIPTDTVDYFVYDSTTNVSVTVNKATPVITMVPTASVITYGQTLASSTLNGGSATTAGSFTFVTPGFLPNAGATNVPVMFTPSDTTDYNNVSTNVIITVNAQTPLISTLPSVGSITYGQTLASSSLTGGAATNAAGGLVGGTFGFATLGIAPNAGSTNVSVMFTPTDNVDYNSASSVVSVTVNKATPMIAVAPTVSAITYGQTLGNSSLSGGSATNTAGGEVGGIFSFDSPSTMPGAGTAEQLLDFIPTDTADYNNASTTVSVTVNAQTPLIASAPSAGAITVGQILASSCLSGGAATNATGVSVNGSFGFTTPEIIPNAGCTNVSVTFTPTDTTDYTNATTSVSVTVNGLPILSVTPGAANNIILNWSSWATNGFLLETTTNLLQPGGWMVLQTITNKAGVTIPAPSLAGFFRLYQP